MDISTESPSISAIPSSEEMNHISSRNSSFTSILNTTDESTASSGEAMTQASTQEVHNNADFLGSPILSGLPHTAISKTSSPPTAVGPETLVSTALAIWCENEADIQARQRETETTIYNPSISFHTDFDSQSPFHTPHISQVSVRGSPEETDEKLSQYGGGLGTFSQRSKTSANISAEEAGFEVDSDKKGQLQSAPDRLIEEESLFVSGYADGDPSQLGDLYSYQHQFKSGDSISEGNNVLQVAEDKIIINGLEAAGKGDVGVSVKPQKKKRPKTGPRPKSSKEWFAKRSKDSLQSLPQISGLKRKRSKKEPESDSARHGKRKKSKKSTVDKSTKKKGRNKKSKKVMTAMFENLRHSNAIEARIALGDLPEADPIIAKTKGDQFEQILRGIPKDADKRSIASDKRKLEEATRSFGYGNCVANDGKWLVKGMKTSLHPHQLVGTSWMLRREFSDGGPYGGILADEMGMGKTLQTLACIVSNRPTDEDLDTYNRTTLIVVPAAAISQWEDEIRKHADGKYIHGVLHYKKSKGLPVEVLGHMGVIIVSYQEVSRHFPSKKVRDDLQNHSGSVEDWKEGYDENLGPLFKIPFWRIVLDEAHNIKNKDSQMSIACQNLTGRHRWALSGTPITNSIDELYPYLKFLKADWAGDLKDFQYLYGNTADDEAADRLTVMMKILMLRRTMKDSFMGRPLYEIPKCHIDVRRIPLTREETVIYNVVESRYREIINNILKKKKWSRNQKVRMWRLEIYIVFLMRLRQAVAHPFLLEPVLKNTLKLVDLLKIKKLLRQVGGKKPVYKQIGKWCAKEATSIKAKDENDQEDANNSFGNSQFGYEFNMDQQLDIALASKKEGVCRFCYQEPIEPRTAECEHVFCRECLEGYFENEIRGGRIIPRCPECNTCLTGYESLEESDEEDSDIDRSTRGVTRRRIGVYQRKPGRDIFGQHPKLKKSQSRFLKECDQAHPKPVVPSAKTTAVKEAILAWQSEAPDDKIIIFMEFKMTGAILGRMLEDEGIPFLYFFGDMSPVAKQNALRGLREKNKVKVMIASIRCGSVALNLTYANRVILVDLWWNTAIELQAFGRVFRIGQTKETHFLRIVTEKTIDNRIEALQEKKMENINKALEPGETRKLSTEEVAALFGHLKKSADGSLEILPDGEDDVDSRG